MMGNARTAWARRIGASLVLVVALIHLALRVQLMTDHRVDLGGAEINVVYGIQKILLGKPLYEDPEEPPFDVMQYTPAYYVLCAGIGKVLGMDPHGTYALFLLSRATSLLLNLITCLWVYRLCRALNSDAWLAVTVSALAFTLFTEHFYSRTDSLYALLFTGTLFMHVRWMEQGGTRLLLFTALMAVLCLFSKQTGLLVIGIVGAHLLIARQWRPLLVFGGAVLFLTAAGLLAIFSGTTPEVFLENTVQGIANGMTRTMYIELFHLPNYKYYVLFHAAGLAFIWNAARRGDAQDRFLAVAIAVALVFGFATGLKHGSNINYLFEAHLLAAIATARWIGTRTAAWQLPFLLFALLFTVHRNRLLRHRVGTDADRSRSMAAYQADLHVRDVLVNELGLRPDDWVLITYRGHLELLLNGQGLLAQKDIIEWSVDPLFDLASFERMMDDGRVRFVIGDAPLDTLRFIGRAWGPLRPVRAVDGRCIHTLPAR